jgi:hypothetical protein
MIRSADKAVNLLEVLVRLMDLADGGTFLKI